MAVKKKKVVRKRVGTSTTKKSMATKKAPSARLKRRRKANTKQGYYPNPIKKAVRVTPTGKSHVVGMDVNGRAFYVTATVNRVPVAADTDERKAMRFLSRPLAATVARALQQEYPDNVIFVRESRVW